MYKNQNWKYVFVKKTFYLVQYVARVKSFLIDVRIIANNFQHNVLQQGISY